MQISEHVAASLLSQPCKCSRLWGALPVGIMVGAGVASPPSLTIKLELRDDLYFT